MQRRFGMAVAVLTFSLWSSPMATVDGNAQTNRLTPLSQTTVRHAIDLARAKLALPDCSNIYGDFELQPGVTPRTELERMGIGPEQFLETLVFIGGSQDSLCRSGRAVLTAIPGSRVIRVCPGFARFQLQQPGLAASLIIHESLHALGLGENPPSGRDITQRIERRCWKPAKRAPRLREPIPVSIK